MQMEGKEGKLNSAKEEEKENRERERGKNKRLKNKIRKPKE